MLVFNDERLIPTDVNVLVFAGKTGNGYFYIHRSLYDQAVIINDLYRNNIPALCSLLSDSNEIREDVEYFMSVTPEPISTLAPFLFLIKEPVEKFMDMVGALHVMSVQFDLRKMLQVPEEVRVSLMYSLHITEEYQLSWDRFLASSIPYVKPVLLAAQSQNLYTIPIEAADPDEGFTEEDKDLFNKYRELGFDEDYINSLKGEGYNIVTLNETESDAAEQEAIKHEIKAEEDVIVEEQPMEEAAPVHVKPSGLDIIRQLL